MKVARLLLENNAMSSRSQFSIANVRKPYKMGILGRNVLIYKLCEHLQNFRTVFFQAAISSKWFRIFNWIVRKSLFT